MRIFYSEVKAGPCFKINWSGFSYWIRFWGKRDFVRLSCKWFYLRLFFSAGAGFTLFMLEPRWFSFSPLSSRWPNLNQTCCSISIATMEPPSTLPHNTIHIISIAASGSTRWQQPWRESQSSFSVCLQRSSHIYQYTTGLHAQCALHMTEASKKCVFPLFNMCQDPVLVVLTYDKRYLTFIFTLLHWIVTAS